LRIVLVGAGEVGYSVAKSLSEDGHEITVVEDDYELVSYVEKTLDVIVVKGNGARPSVLERAGVRKDSDEVKLLIACTNRDEVNIMACWIAKITGVPSVIARAVGLEFTDNEGWAKILGIDLMISPERSAAKEVDALLEVRGATHAIEVAGGKAGIYVFKVADNSPLRGIDLIEARRRNPKLITLTVAVQRGQSSFLPNATEKLLVGDVCYVICYRSQVLELEKLYQPALGKSTRRVFIVGAGKIGFQVAQGLLTKTSGVEVKIIDEDRAKCERVAGELPGALIICGDGSDAQLLKSEGIESADGIVTATDQDEVNLMVAALGRTLGAGKSIAVVRRPNYIGMTKHIPVDAVLNRNQTLADAIIKSVRYPGSSRILNIIDEIDSEAIEMTIPEKSPASGVPLMELGMPKGSVIGMIERGGELLIPTGTAQLQPHDKILVFASTEVMPLAMSVLGEAVS